MNKHGQPRKPSKDELEQLKAYLQELHTVEAVNESVDAAWIAVFDDYITDSVGYKGRAMCVVWSASPSFYEVYTWRFGKIEQVCQDPLFEAR